MCIMTDIVSAGGLVILAVNVDSDNPGVMTPRPLPGDVDALAGAGYPPVPELPDLAIPVAVGSATRFMIPRAFVCSAVIRSTDNPEETEEEALANPHDGNRGGSQLGVQCKGARSHAGVACSAHV